ncbi:FG-GAP repeat domain-containing protein [Spongiimicrobium sp. 2-473A-2-J]|uniref:FG-GAP repeat domain-containing protein n=1 Tax=Eudoraea algarum TaxID=3417568 RepID=UPI003D361EE1
MVYPVLRYVLFTALFAFAADSAIREEAPGFKNVSDTHLISTRLGNNSMDGEAVDIDQDGDMDMILAMEYKRNVILINDGTGKLEDQSAQRFPDSQHDSEDMAIADFDQDGDMDIVFVSEDDRTNEYYLNKGNGYFENASALLKVKGISNLVGTTDFNSDGFPDLIVGNQGQNFVLLNDGKGQFLDRTSAYLTSNTYTTQDLELADLDGDGDLDMVEANETYNRVLINSGKGSFVDESKKRLPRVNDQTREVEVADIDADGDLDIFFANVDFRGFGNPQNRLLINDGKGYFTEITEEALPKSAYRTVGATFFDVNNDHYMDILSGNRFNGTQMIVLLNDRKSRFVDRTKEYFPECNSYTFDFQVADFNADGLMDVYLCNFRGKDILLFREQN